MPSRRAGGSFAVSAECRDTINLPTPDLAPYGGEGVGEARSEFAVPGAGRDLDAGAAVEASRQQSDDREQAEKAGGGAAIALSDHWRWVSSRGGPAPRGR